MTSLLQLVFEGSRGSLASDSMIDSGNFAYLPASALGKVELLRDLMTADDQTPYYSLKYLQARDQRIGKGIKIEDIIFSFIAASFHSFHGEFYIGKFRTRTGSAHGNLFMLG